MLARWRSLERQNLLLPVGISVRLVFEWREHFNHWQWPLFLVSSHPVRDARDSRNNGAAEDQISQRVVLGISLACVFEVKV